MATLTVTGFTNYFIDTEAWVSVSSSEQVLDDGDGSDLEFTFGEAIKGPAQFYQGTVNIEGTDYIVTIGGNVLRVWGTQLDQSTYPDIPSLGSIDNGTFTVCFAAGTTISVPGGETAVEDLKIGDLILTAYAREVVVKWVGRQTVSTRFGPAERLMLVRVRAGALGGGLPLRDLTLTADHALLIDGLLINAGALVNGTTIDYVPLSELGDSYAVYHVETENHDVILAEGAPAETYIDYVARRAFDNYAEYFALYGEDRTLPEMPYPRISSARMLPEALRARLQAFAAA